MSPPTAKTCETCGAEMVYDHVRGKRQFANQRWCSKRCVRRPRKPGEIIRYPMNFKDISGERIGRLTAAWPIARNRFREVIWLLVCDCGTMIHKSQSALSCTKSCGCLRRETCRSQAQGRAKYPSGTTSSPTYQSWRSAKERCFSLNHQARKNYGGRGITMCARWRNSFPAFLSDMGIRPAGTSLDRFPDNDGNYEPGNCRWATPEQQNRNKRKGSAVRLVQQVSVSFVRGWAK